MTDFAERESAVNQDLRVLDDAHRLGQITRTEYRARRRRLLETLCDPSAVVTARKSLVAPAATTTPRARHATHATAPDDAASGAGDHALTSLLSMRPANRWKILLPVLLGVAVLAVLAYWLLRG